MAKRRKPRARDEHAERTLAAFAEAVIRMLLAVAKAERMIDARGARLARRIAEEHPVLRDLTRERIKATAKEEAFMLRFDEERALQALALMLPTEKERREAVDIVRQIGYADGEITPEGEAVLERIERILALGQASGSKMQKTEAPARRARKAAR